MKRISLASAVLAHGLALVPPLVAQKVLVVGGPSGAYAQIQPAVDAAADGDVVLVHAGTYMGFTIHGKGIAMTSDLGEWVEIVSPVVVESLSAGSRASLRGLRILTHFDTPPLQLKGNVGSVWVEDCMSKALDATTAGVGVDAVSVTSCASVVFHRCAFTASNGVFLDILFNGPGGTGVVAANSSVSMFATVAKGGKGAPHLFNTFAKPGGRGVSANAGTWFISGSTVLGGDGGDDPFVVGAGAQGGIGLWATASVVSIDSTFMGGSGGADSVGGLGPSGADTFSGPGGSLTLLPGAARTLNVDSPVRELQSSAVSLHGRPGELAIAFFASQPMPPLQLLPFGGVLLLPTGSVVAVVSGTTDPNGDVSLGVPIPALPAAIEGVSLWAQSVFADSGVSAATLGPPSTLVVLDSAF